MTADQTAVPPPADERLRAYRGRRALVTGGLGFIGSSVARSLTKLGCAVTVVDSMAPDQGGNRFNLKGVAENVDVRIADIRNETAMADAVKGQDFVFSMAAILSHLGSLESPFEDVDVNVRGTLVILEAVRKHAPEARVVYSGTRSAYGLIQRRPVDENHPLIPTEVNSANRAVADLYHTAYFHAHGLQTTVLRLPNVYGPRMLVAHARQGFMNWFVRLALDGGTLRLYGDGTQVRDLVYVDDTVRAMLLAPLEPGAAGQTFNVGSGEPVSLKEIAELLIEATGRGNIEIVPFPADAGRIEIGDYVADVSKITRALDWTPLISLREGIGRTVRYFRKHREHYW